MAKDLRSRMVLDISDLRNSLSQAERETRKTVAAIERESKTSITAIRGGLLGGLGAGNSVAELKAYQRESMGIGGGADARYNGMFGPTQRKSGEYGALFSSKPMGLESTVKIAAQAAAAITALDVATKVWNGDLQGAADTIKRLPFGLGQVATMLESVIGSWTGWTAEIQKNEAEAKKVEETQKRINDQLRARIQFEKESRSRASDAFAQANIAGLSGYQATVAQTAYSERQEIGLARERMEQARRADPGGASRYEEAYRKEVVAIQEKYIAEGRKAMWADADARMAEAAKRRTEAAKAKADEEKLASDKLRMDAEKRGAAMVEISRNREAEYMDRQRQSRYDPYSGNAALESQTLTRVPGSGNRTITEDPKVLAESQKHTRILERIERLQERNQLAAAEL